ncbi:MAG: hypothetical protein WAU07_05000 [Microgenomates group bacterium]
MVEALKSSGEGLFITQAAACDAFLRLFNQIHSSNASEILDSDFNFSISHTGQRNQFVRKTIRRLQRLQGSPSTLPDRIQYSTEKKSQSHTLLMIVAMPVLPSTVDTWKTRIAEVGHNVVHIQVMIVNNGLLPMIVVEHDSKIIAEIAVTDPRVISNQETNASLLSLSVIASQLPMFSEMQEYVKAHSLQKTTGTLILGSDAGFNQERQQTISSQLLNEDPIQLISQPIAIEKILQKPQFSIGFNPNSKHFFEIRQSS